MKDATSAITGEETEFPYKGDLVLVVDGTSGDTLIVEGSLGGNWNTLRLVKIDDLSVVNDIQADGQYAVICGENFEAIRVKVAAYYAGSLFYIWNRPYNFVTFNENDLGTVVYIEWYDNQFSDLIKGLSGSIYECVDDMCIHPTHIAGVYNSEVPVNVSKETVIDDVFEEIRKRIADGRVILRTYGSLNKEEKEKIIECDMVRAIHQQRLLKWTGT